MNLVVMNQGFGDVITLAEFLGAVNAKRESELIVLVKSELEAAFISRYLGLRPKIIGTGLTSFLKLLRYLVPHFPRIYAPFVVNRFFRAFLHVYPKSYQLIDREALFDGDQHRRELIAGAFKYGGDFCPASEISFASSSASYEPNQVYEKSYIVGILLGVGKTEKYKLPNAEWFWGLSSFLAKRNIQPILFGSHADIEVFLDARTLIEPSYFPDTCIDLPLDELESALRTCHVVIGGNTGLSHFAAWLGVDSIILGGVACDRVSGPVPNGGNQVVVLRHNTRCGGCYRRLSELGLEKCAGCINSIRYDDVNRVLKKLVTEEDS